MGNSLAELFLDIMQQIVIAAPAGGVVNIANWQFESWIKASFGKILPSGTTSFVVNLANVLVSGILIASDTIIDDAVTA